MVASIGKIASPAQGVGYFERDGYYAREDAAHKEASAWAVGHLARVISRYGARLESTAGAASIGPDPADWYRSWSARDAVKVPIRVS